MTGNHEAIIPPSTFDRVQKLLAQRKGGKNRISSVSIYSSKIKCGDCGSWYGSKTWHSTDKYRTRIWQCNHKFEEHCTTPHLKEDEVEYFIEDLKKHGLLTAFDENVWLSMVDYLTVHKDGKVEFTFLDGSVI